MSITKYKTIFERIEVVEVERETADSVWVFRYGGETARRAAKQTCFECYYDSWEEAHAALMVEAERNLEAARQALARAQGKYGNVKGMKAPAP
jgi:hypothetical protein